MNLIDRYVREIGRRLPQKSHADIEKEIRSALEDMLEERARQTGKPADEETILGVLKEYGDPEKVAASYQGERYLIGPRLFPVFQKVMFTLLPVTIVLAFGMSISLNQLYATTANHFLGIVVNIFGGFIGAVIFTLGSVTFIFAILQWSLPEFREKAKEWDPRSLLKIPSPDRIPLAGLIAGIFNTVACIVLFNFFPQLINIGYYSDGSWWVGFISTTTGQAWETTLLSETFFHYLPALDILWGLNILLSILLIRLGHWQAWTRWAYTGLKAIGVGLAIVMLAGPSLIGVTTESLIASGFPDSPETIEALVAFLNQIIRVVLTLAILINGLELVKTLIRLFRSKAPAIMTDKSRA
jgi:hypothetical protein